MSDDAILTTDLWVSAHLRQGSNQGVSMMVLRKGDRSRGTVLLKINRLDGRFQVLTQVRHCGTRAWTCGTGSVPVLEVDADNYIERQVRYDCDLWVIEIEDRLGRHWFDGPVV